MENAIIYIKGVGGQLSLYSDSVKIERKGFLGVAGHGLTGEKNIPLSSITSVQFKPCGVMTNGYIQFSMLGSKESKGGIFDATKDENTVVISAKIEPQALEVKKYIEEYIIKKNTHSQSNSNISAADEILKFKDLLDKGIITQEEFNDKKKQLIGV